MLKELIKCVDCGKQLKSVSDYRPYEWHAHEFGVLCIDCHNDSYNNDIKDSPMTGSDTQTCLHSDKVETCYRESDEDCKICLFSPEFEESIAIHNAEVEYMETEMECCDHELYCGGCTTSDEQKCSKCQ
jgi:hypothetical protein